MEEAIYKRQVAKISMSLRVVDEQQIKRHFQRNDLEKLYSIQSLEPPINASNELPHDHILAQQLIDLKDNIYTYHSHESLLRKNDEENLSQEERDLAWHEYKSEESKGSKSHGSSKFPCLQIGKNPFEVIDNFSGK